MAIAMTLKSYLEAHHVDDDMVRHAHSGTSLESTLSAHVPSNKVAKAVELESMAHNIISAENNYSRWVDDWAPSRVLDARAAMQVRRGCSAHPGTRIIGPR